MECVDNIELEASVPLPPPSRDVAPPGYLVLNSLKEGEGNAPFACPHRACDGFTFDTAFECHIHEDEWHSHPYRCTECDTIFAAKPALARHLKATGHFNLICEEKGCDMEGIRFENRETFMAHALVSSFHQRLLHGRWEDERNRLNYDESNGALDGLLSEDSSDEEERVCLEPSCSKYQRFYPSERQYDQHINSHGHINAVKLSEKLKQSGLSESEIESKQESARVYRCEAEGCPLLGKKLASSQSYYHHIVTSQHRSPKGPSEVDTTSPTPVRKHKSLDVVKTSCTEVECPKYRHPFVGTSTYKKHIRSAAHVKAMRYGEMMRLVAARADTSDNNSTSPSTHVWGQFSPISPATDTTHTGNAMAFITPTKCPISSAPVSPLMSPSSWREECLEKKNKELEEQLQQLRSEMSMLKIVHEKRVDMLLDMLSRKE